MNPILYRYKDTESVIKVMDGYTHGEGWEPLYSQDQVDQLQAQLVRQQSSYEAEIKVEIDAALERAAIACESIETDKWSLYKGRPPYTGTEPGRADNYVQGESDGAGQCASAIRALKESKE